MVLSGQNISISISIRSALEVSDFMSIKSLLIIRKFSVALLQFLVLNQQESQYDTLFILLNHIFNK